MTGTDGWDGILDPGERIIWQGRPDGGLLIRPQNIAMAAFGAFFAGFALFWMVMAAQGGGGFWMFGLLHFAVGIGIVAGALFWNTFERRRSFYTLTDRRAFIATDIPLQGQRLSSWPITEDTHLEFVDGALQTINFATKTRRTKNGHSTRPIGFERIPDGRDVYRMMRDIQTRACQTAGTDLA